MTDDELLQRLREMANEHGQGLAPLATAEQIAETERLLGHPLPPFLRRVYAEIGNGGIGPNENWRYCWLSGILGGIGNDWDITALGEYLDRRGEATGIPEQDWPIGLLPLCHVGCGEYHCVDCTTPEGEMVHYRNEDPDVSWFRPTSFRPLGTTIRDWLALWVEPVPGT